MFDLDHVCNAARSSSSNLPAIGRREGNAAFAIGKVCALPRTSHRSAKSPARGQKRRRQSVDSLPGRLFDRMGTLTSFASNKFIFKKGEPAEYLYRMRVRLSRPIASAIGGRRRIHAFYFPGDHFGLEAHEEHSISAVTVTPSSVRLVKRKALVSRAARDIVVVNLLLHITTIELQRTQNHNLLLLKGAHERLVDFLREIQRRNQCQSEIDLPMPRSDIADYLGLTIETVSRALTRLKNTSTISMLTHRRVILRGPVVPD